MPSKWFDFPPHLFSVRTLIWETKTLKTPSETILAYF